MKRSLRSAISARPQCDNRSRLCARAGVPASARCRGGNVHVPDVRRHAREAQAARARRARRSGERRPSSNSGAPTRTARGSSSPSPIPMAPGARSTTSSACARSSSIWTALRLAPFWRRDSIRTSSWNRPRAAGMCTGWSMIARSINSARCSARLFGGSVAIRPLPIFPRVMRLPGFLHRKGRAVPNAHRRGHRLHGPAVHARRDRRHAQARPRQGH